MKSNKEIIAEAISKLSAEEKALIYPPMERKNFVVRKGWMGRNQVISFNTKATKTKPSVKVTYDHDEVFSNNQEKLLSMKCFNEYGNYTNSNKIPKWAV